mmetsp:Transcript_14806/g.13397  ORF Transcript_14806/g.13397 Transcript_14806/m.13397 type:complete len:112 (+) Transcript_14806:833-1168(+)
MSHFIKANGLALIFKSFKNIIRQNIRSKYLVFIVPKYGELDRAQPLHTRNGNVMTLVPTKANNFRQCVCNYSISNDTASNEQNVIINNIGVNSSDTPSSKAIRIFTSDDKR